MLKKLEDLRDFTMAEGSPDLRGWDVYDKNGERLACVDSMVVDTKLEKGNRMFVRYLAIKHEDMDHLIPIEKADIDQENRRVNLSIDREALMNAPEYHGEAYHEDEACRLRASFFQEQKEKEFVSAEPKAHVEKPEVREVHEEAKKPVEFESSEPERRRRFSEGAAPEAKCKMESDAQRERFLEWKRRQR